MVDETERSLLGRDAAVEFTLGAIIRHMPPEARDAVLSDLRMFAERSDPNHESGRALADAAASILKEATPR